MDVYAKVAKVTSQKERMRNMGVRQYIVKCTLCNKETALIGEDIDKKYTIEFYERQGWSFSKYKTMCPECKKEEAKKWEQIEMEV